MPDKTALVVSEELRQYIEALVEEVVLEGKPFENHKKYLHRFCETEGVDYELLDKNLADFFSIMNHYRFVRSKYSTMMAKKLGGSCFLSETVIDKLISLIPEKGLIFMDDMEKLGEVKHIVICHSEVPTPHEVEDIHAWHLKKGRAGVGYHFFINKKGEVYQGRPLAYMGAFSKEVNRVSVGVCFAGDFTKENLDLQKQLSNEAIELLALLRYAYHADIMFYDELGNNPSLPGFPKDEIRKRITACYDHILAEEERVFGSEESARFYEWIKSRMLQYGIPYKKQNNYSD